MTAPVRILVLGRPGVGRSSLSNRVLGAEVFPVNHSSVSQPLQSVAHSGTVRGLQLTVIDSPALCSSDSTHTQRHAGKWSSLVQSSPGPHVVLLVLKIEKCTDEEPALVRHMVSVFGEEVFKFTIVVFTHGDDLHMDISEFVSANPVLRDLVQRCEGRCHVVDHSYWDREESNQKQLSEIFKSIEDILRFHRGGFFINKDLQTVERDIQKEQAVLLKSTDLFEEQSMSEEDSRDKAKERVQEKYLKEAEQWQFSPVIVAGFVIASGLIYQSISRALRGNPESGCPPKAVEEVLLKPTAAVIEALPEVTVIQQTLGNIIKKIIQKLDWIPRSL